MSNPSKRQRRSRIACEPCRDRKRKCDGHRPCATCNEFEYNCYYDLEARKKRNKKPVLGNSTSVRPTQTQPQDSRLEDTTVPAESPADLPAHSLESNSGAAFVRGLGIKIDPVNAPEPQFFAWNIGARQSPGDIAALPVVDIISQQEMKALADNYFDKVDPYYGFIDRDYFFDHLNSRWRRPYTLEPYDAVLCGVAAMGYLFSQRKAPVAELHLVESARSTLEQYSMSGIPFLDIITGWAVRLAYLRLTASPHTAWMASCSLLHMIEAAGLHWEPSSKPVLMRSPKNIDPDIRRRLLGFAQYVNMWISFDLGRSRVLLHGTSYTAPMIREGDYTIEMLSLLPLSESLDPHKSVDSIQLTNMLSSLLESIRTQPPSILSHCNLILCVYRRLRALHSDVCEELMDRMLTLITKALGCARDMVQASCPWSHVANVPFQIVCTLLVIDSHESLSRLGEAMQTVKLVADIYDTDVMREAYRTAGLLILLQQKRKYHHAKTLNDLLDAHFTAPVVSDMAMSNEGLRNVHNSESLYLSDLVAEMPNFENFDFAQFFIADNPGDMLEIAS
ncbi:putative C6 transcription factor [Lipomyces doorenjongii]